MALSMDRECGEERKEIVMLGNGSSARLTAMEFMCGSMEIDTKENSSNASNTAWESNVSQTETSTRAIS